MSSLSSIAQYAATIGHYLLILFLAALLGAALSLLRPGRREIVPRAPHVIQAQILLAIVGAIIIVVVAESLARAFAIVGAAGLIRYRARISDPKDAGVMLVALAVGLTVGSGLYGFAIIASLFVIGVLWVLESHEPPARSRFEKFADRYYVMVLSTEVPGEVYQLKAQLPAASGSSAEGMVHGEVLTFERKEQGG